MTYVILAEYYVVAMQYSALDKQILLRRIKDWVQLFCGRCLNRGAGAGPAGTAAVGPMLEAKHMNLIKGRLQKF